MRSRTKSPKRVRLIARQDRSKARRRDGQPDIITGSRKNTHGGQTRKSRQRTTRVYRSEEVR
jgi:hypothetical protein